MTGQLTALRLVLILAALHMIIACMPQQRRADKLVMDVGRAGASQIAGILVLFPTTGAELTEVSIWDHPAPTLDNDEHSELLLGTLRQSGLFYEVTTHPPGDLELRSEIIFQETIPGLNSTYLLLVRYVLTDVSTQRIVWQENLCTRKDFSAKQAVYGSHNVVRLMEEAHIANLEKLIDRLSAVLGR